MKEYTFSILKYFKDRESVLAQFAQKKKHLFAPFYLSQMTSEDVICTASPIFLVQALLATTNKDATVVGSQISLQTLKYENGSKNCKASHKIDCLKKFFSTDTISCENAYSDSLTDIFLFDIAQKGYLVIKATPSLYKTNGAILPIPFNFGNKIKATINILRVKHYLKNGLILMPLFLAGLILDTSYWLTALMALFAFCFLSSFVYILNDLFDVTKDRLHSTKRLRPLASGMLAKSEGIVLALILLAMSTILAILFTNTLSIVLLAIYLVINILYSLKLKHLPIIDLFVLSFCYIVRVMFGSALFGIDVSIWFYLVVFAVSMFMGITKRKNEILTQTQTTREVNKKYSKEFLDKNATTFYVMTFIFYALWIMQIYLGASSQLNGLLLILSIPIVYLVMMRYTFQTDNGASSGNPIEVLFQDLILIVLMIVYIAIMAVALYVDLSFITL